MEDEVVKHTKKIYKTWFNKETTIWHKISEFLIEMLIIFFAVSISIWFHNRSEHAHEQAEVKAFMLGLKSDLSGDILEMQNDKESYQQQGKIFNYFISLKMTEPPSKDTLKKYQHSLFVTTTLNPNDGRFEGFKSAGKIGTIENKELQNDIMDLYQENIPALLQPAMRITFGKPISFITLSRIRKGLQIVQTTLCRSLKKIRYMTSARY